MPHTKKHYRLLAYVAGFFLAFYSALPAYFNAKFLSNFLSESKLGFVYALGALLSIIVLLNSTKILRRIGNLNFLQIVTILSLLVVTALAFAKGTLLALTLFVFYYVLSIMIVFSLDIYLEELTENENTGGTRGLFLTAVNLAWLISAFFGGRLIADGNFSKLYLLAMFALVPFAVIVFFLLRSPGKERFDQMTPFHAFLKIKRSARPKDKNIARILTADFALNFFYSVMVVYMALYLTNHLGFTTIDIAKIFSVMLIPFVLVDYPLGKLADKEFGERELLVAGLVIAGLATIAASITLTKTIWVWAFILFMTRVGASIVEIMKETYLFKQIDSENSEILSLSRCMPPLSYIIAPVFTSLFLLFFDLRYIWLVLGILVLLAVYPTLKLRDTK